MNTDTKPSNTSEQDVIVIGITGRKRSGKDTIGEYLVDQYGFVRVAFADALKEACKIIFGFTDDQVYGDVSKETIDEYWQHSPREILQKVGTELFREKLPEICNNITNNIWIKSVERKINNLMIQGHTRFVITDVRFPNELAFINMVGNRSHGVTWKVMRPILKPRHQEPCSTTEIAAHASEILIDDFKCDTEFRNNGTLAQLYENVDSELQKVFNRNICPISLISNS
jgi:hypothetical protein